MAIPPDRTVRRGISRAEHPADPRVEPRIRPTRTREKRTPAGSPSNANPVGCRAVQRFVARVVAHVSPESDTGVEGFDDDPLDDAQAADSTRARKIRVEPSSFFIGNSLRGYAGTSRARSGVHRRAPNGFRRTPILMFS